MESVKFASVGCLAAFAIGLCAPAVAQSADIGKLEFNNSCAQCHGTDGKGNGPLADMLKSQIADLTALRKNNGGVFPFERVFQIIEGPGAVKGHGSSDMPAWGQIYNSKAPQATGPFGTGSDYSAFVRGRILALIGYIDTLQVK